MLKMYSKALKLSISMVARYVSNAPKEADRTEGDILQEIEEEIEEEAATETVEVEEMTVAEATIRISVIFQVNAENQKAGINTIPHP